MCVKIKVLGWQFSMALKEVTKFFKLGLAGLLMVLFEWWSFELLVLIAGSLECAPLLDNYRNFSCRLASQCYDCYWSECDSCQCHKLYLHVAFWY